MRNSLKILMISLVVLFALSLSTFFVSAGQKVLSVNSGDASTLGDSSFQQSNLYLGYRLPRQRAELSFGVLNLTGGDYHLNPLNAQPELPRERLYLARLQFRF